METRVGIELGMKHIHHGGIKKQRPVNVESKLIGRDMNNKLYDQIQRDMRATRPSQTKTYYKIQGSVVNVVA